MLDEEAIPTVTAAVSNTYWSRLFLALIPLTTILGNMLVILSVLEFKSLQTAINFLIFGLAIADLFVAVFVMPFAVYIEISGGMWFLGDLMCNIYSAIDVACSTASILILAVISFDRYRAVSKPISYSRKTQNTTQVFYMLGGIWGTSLALASPIVFGANTRPAKVNPYECRLYHPYFLIFSSIISFIIPCFVVLFVYLRILQELRKREKAACLRHTAKSNQIPIAQCSGSVPGEDSTISMDDTIRINADTDDTALCSSSEVPSTKTSTAKQVPRKMLTFFRKQVSTPGNFRSRFQRLYLKRQLGLQHALDNKYHSVDEVSRTTADTTPSHSFSNCSTFDTSNIFTDSCPCSHALCYGLSLNRVKDSNEDSTLSTIIVPHSQFYRFCRALTRKAVIVASKQSDAETNADSNANTISSMQSICDNHKTSGAPTVTFNVIVPEQGFNSGDISNKTLEADDCLLPHKSLSSTLESNYDLPALSLSKKSDLSSLSTLFRSRLQTKSGDRRSAAKRKSSKMIRKERRATKTLGIVVGVFLLCWLPFFSMNILNAICIMLKVEACEVDFDIFFYCTWLGYMNSFMNPIIYTIFNAEFRRSFKIILHLDTLRKLPSTLS